MFELVCIVSNAFASCPSQNAFYTHDTVQEESKTMLRFLQEIVTDVSGVSTNAVYMKTLGKT